MKEYFAWMLSLILALSLAACGSAPEAAEATAAPVQLANPYLTFADADQMQASAGLEVSLPEDLPQWVTETVYRAIPGELVEVIYRNEENEIRVRIKNGSEDISGVYDADSKEGKDITLGDNTVHLKGEAQDFGDFLVFVSTWQTQDGQTYSVTSPLGVPEAELLPILQQIR